MENNPPLEFEDEQEYGVIEHENEDSAPLFIDTSILNSKVGFRIHITLLLFNANFIETDTKRFVATIHFSCDCD